MPMLPCRRSAIRTHHCRPRSWRNRSARTAATRPIWKMAVAVGRARPLPVFRHAASVAWCPCWRADADAELSATDRGVRIRRGGRCQGGCNRACTVLPLCICGAGASIRVDAERDLLRCHQAILPDIGGQAHLGAVGGAYGALPIGLLLAGTGVII